MSHQTILRVLKEIRGDGAANATPSPLYNIMKNRGNFALSDETALVCSPVAQTAMIDEPAHETMVIRLFAGLSFFILLTQLDELTSFLHRKTLVQEGINEQIHILLHIGVPPFVRQCAMLFNIVGGTGTTITTIPSSTYNKSGAILS
jgi:hypothetical protein